MDNKPEKMKFARLSERFNTAASAVAAHAPYVALQATAFPPQEIAKNTAIIGAVFLALRVRYLKEIPMLLTNLLIMPLLLRKRSRAPENIQSITDEFAAKAGYKRQIKTYVYEKGMTKNAVSIGDRLYIGKGLIDNMSNEELRFVIGHELAHTRNNDLSERYLFWPPFIQSALMCIGAAQLAVSSALNPEAVPPSVALPMAAGVGAYFLGYQRALWGHASRICEYRADRNAVQFTGNPEAGVSALQKLESMNGMEGKAKRSWYQSLVATHPSIDNRIKNIRKEAAALNLA